MMRDPDLGMIRVRAFGRFAFRIEDVVQFSREVLAARKLFSTTDIVSYLASIIGESVATTLAKSGVSALDFAMGYREHGAPGGRSRPAGRLRPSASGSRTSSLRTPPFPTKWSSLSTSSPASPSRARTWLRSWNTRTPAPCAMRRSRKAALRDWAQAPPLGVIMAERVSSAQALHLRKKPTNVQTPPPRSPRLCASSKRSSTKESCRKRNSRQRRSIFWDSDPPKRPHRLDQERNRIIGKEGRIDVPKPQRRACRAVLPTHHLGQPFPIARTATEKADAQMGQDRRHRLRGARPHRRRVHVRQERTTRGAPHRALPRSRKSKKTDDSSKATKDEPKAPVVPEKTEEEKAAEARAQAKADATVSSGTYKVGSEIPAGQYYLVGSGYFAILKDGSGTLDAIIANDNFSGNSIVDLADGQYFELKGASMYPIEFYDPIEKTEFKDGTYRVGIDMPAGEYKVNLAFGIRVHRSHLRREPYARRHHHERPRRGQHVPDRERRTVRQALGSHGHAGVSRPCSTRADGSRRRMREPSALSCDRAATAGVPPARAAAESGGHSQEGDPVRAERQP